MIAGDPGNARMLDRLTDLRSAVAAPPDVAACPSPEQGAGRGSFPEGTYDMVLENDARSQCPDGPPRGTPGRKSWYSLEVRDNEVTIRQRVDSQTAPWGVGYNGVYSTLRDRVRIGTLTARWSFDGTALRLSDMTGGSCGDTVIWTTNPWVLRSGPAQVAPVPDGTYETVLTPADRRLCDGQPDAARPQPPKRPRWHADLVHEHHARAGSGEGVRARGQPRRSPTCGGWAATACTATRSS